MRIEFQIRYAVNEQIYQNGFVEFEVNENNEETDVEWSYYDQNGFVIPREFTYHDGVELTPTDKQNAEIDAFLELIHIDFVDYIQDIILTSKEHEHKTYQNDVIIIDINGGDDELWLQQ